MSTITGYDDDTAPLLEVVEAECRRRMATVTKARGFDTQRQRDRELYVIDQLLDEYNEARHGNP